MELTADAILLHFNAIDAEVDFEHRLWSKNWVCVVRKDDDDGIKVEVRATALDPLSCLRDAYERWTRATGEGWAKRLNQPTLLAAPRGENEPF